MPDPVTPTVPPPAKKARKPKPSAPKPPAKERKKPVHAVSAYLNTLSPAHAEAAKVLGVEFKSLLRDELALDAKAAALAERRNNLEHDLAYVTQAWNECVPSKACRNRLDVLAASIAKAKGVVPQDAPTDDDHKGVEIP